LSIFIEKDGKKILPRSVYIKILVFAGLVCLSAVLMQPIQSAINRLMFNIRTNFLERIEQQIGMEIRYSSIRPTFFGSFDIRNLRLIKNETVFLSVSRARLFFSIPELVIRKKFAVNTIQIDNPVLRVNYERDKDTFELLSSMFKNNEESDREFFQQISDFLPEDADYRIRNFSLFFSGEEAALDVQSMDVDIRWNGEKIIIGGKFSLDAGYSGFLDRSFLAKTAVEINGAYSPDSREGTANVALSTLFILEQDVKKREASLLWPQSSGGGGLSSIFTLRPLSMEVSFNENSLNVSPPQDASFSYGFDYDFKTGAANASVNFNNFIFNDHADIFVYWKKFNHIFNIAINGSASLNYEKSGELEYNVNLTGGDFFRYARPQTAVITDAFVIRAYGNKERVVLNDFRLSASSITAGTGLFQGILTYQGRLDLDPLIPNGSFTISRLSLNGRGDISASFNVAANTREVNVSGDTVKVGNVSFLNPDVRLSLQDRYIGITAALDNENEGTVYLDAVLNRNPLQLEATLSLASFSIVDIAEVIQPFADFFSIPPSSLEYIQNISIDSEIFFTTDFKNIVYNAPYTVVSISNNKLFLSLSGTDRQVTLSEGLFNISDNEFLVAAQFNFSNPSELIFLLDANYLDMSWHVEGQLLDGTTLIVRDPNGLNVYGYLSNTGSASGYIECVNFPVPIGGNQSYLNLYLTLRYDSLDFWYLDVAHLEMRSLEPLNNGADYLRISGVADQDGASFREILYSDAIGLLAGSADVVWDSDFSYLQFFINMTDGRGRGEQYNIEGVYKNNHISLNASVTELHLERFVKGSGTVLISADARVSWDSIHSFNAQIDLSSLYARTQDSVITASGAASLTNDEILLRNIKFDYGDLKSTVPFLQLNRADGLVKTNANIQGPFIKWMEGDADLYAEFARVDSWLEIRQALDSIDGTLTIANIHYGDIIKDEFAFVFSSHNGNVSFSGGERNMLRFDMDSSGNFFAGLSSPVPIQGTIAGVYKDGVIDAHCNNFFIDMTALWELTTDLSDFSINGGYITGNMDFRGPLFNPEFFGEGRGSSFRLQVPGFIPEDIRPVPFNIVAQGYEFTFGPTAAMTGSGYGNISGWMRFENWAPVNIGLDIDVPSQNPIPYNLNITGFLASGSVFGQLNLSIDSANSLMEVSGNLFAIDTEMGLNMDELMARNDNESSSEGTFHSIVNMTITAGTMVEFIWPNTNSPILRAYPEMGTVFRISADTLAGQYSLNSDVKIRSGELYYFERSFYIREGSMIFRENENQFAPLLSARAEIRDRSDSGPVTITMVIENQPLNNFEPRFETTPSLTQLEIYSILGQNLNNIQGNDNADATQRFILTSTTDLLTQFVVSSDVFSQFIPLRQIERSIRNFLGLDMFNVRTRLVQNAIVSGVTGLAQGPVDRNSSIGNYFDNTTVFIGKYIGQDVFIQGMITMKYDENSSVMGGLVFEPDIGIELQSPYFNIRWDFFPNHPENFWVNDMSITLSWSKSF